MPLSRYRPAETINPFGAPVLLASETGSTMDDARALAEGGCPHGTVARALFQTGGRGRFRDRSWLNEGGRDLQFTIVLESRSVGTGALPLTCGLALLRALDPMWRPDAPPLAVKWPNDLMAGNRKAAGILCEAAGGRYFAGIGVNCLIKEFPASIAGKATTLEDALGTAVDIDALFVGILAELRALVPEPFRPEDYSDRLYARGRRVRFLEGMPERGEVIEGVLEGVGPGGELLIRGDTGRLSACVSGELLLYKDDPGSA